MTVQQDETFKACAHALVLGCTLPIFAYNVGTGRRRNLMNASIYTLFLAWECWHIAGHLRDASTACLLEKP